MLPIFRLVLVCVPVFPPFLFLTLECGLHTSTAVVGELGDIFYCCVFGFKVKYPLLMHQSRGTFDGWDSGSTCPYRRFCISLNAHAYLIYFFFFSLMQISNNAYALLHYRW